MDCAHVCKILCNQNPLSEKRVDVWCEALKCSREFLQDLIKIGSKKPFEENVNAC
jgi:hypothetical protein